MVRRVVWLVVLLLSSPVASWATTYYAAPGGSGACTTNPNGGSTFTTGLGCLSAGDTLYLKAGTYSFSPPSFPSGTSTQRIIIASAPGETAVLMPNYGGAGQGALMDVNASYLTFDRLVVDGTTFCQDGANNLFKLQTSSHHIRISNSVLRNCQGHGQAGENPVGGTKGVLTTTTTHHNEFLNTEIHHNSGYGIYMNSSDNLVDGCNIHDNDRFGLHLYDDNSANVQRNIVRNTRLWNNGPNSTCPFSCGECGGCNQSGMVMIGADHKVYNNLIYTNAGGGIQMQASTTLVANNTIYGNQNDACIFGGGDGEARNNICANNAGGNGIGMSGTLAKNLSTNPGLAAPSTGDFHLTAAATTAINQGDSLSGTFTTDFENNTRPIGSAWDIGAYEFGASGGTTRYVAKTGLDTNDGSTGSPYLTIQRCATVSVSGDRCLIRDGTYRETVTPAANGVTYQPDGSAVVTVSGADVVTGWTVHSGNIYKSTGMTWTLGVGRDQVFVDGVMMNLARHPNASLDLQQQTYFTADGGEPTTDAQLEACYNPWIIQDSALTQGSGFFTGAEITIMAHLGYSQAGVVQSSQAGSLTFTNLHDCQQRLSASSGNQYKYYLSGKLNLLDTGGEWFWESPNTLYLWTTASDNPSGHTVEAKRRQVAFDLSNRSNVTINRLNIFAATITSNMSSASNILDGLHMKYVWHNLRNLPAAGIGQTDAKWGAWMTGVLLSGAQNVLKNCEIQYSSANGVYLHGNLQTVDNCHIHDTGYIKVEGGPVSWMGDDTSGNNPHSSNHIVTNSTLHDTGSNGINLYYADGIQITHNEIYNWGWQVGDDGGVYTVKPPGSGTIAYNRIHDSKADFLRFGIYLDDGASDYLVHHNVVWNVAYGITSKSTNNHFYNNTVWFTDIGMSDQGQSGNRAYNNIVNNTVMGDDQQNNLETSNNSIFVDAAGFNFQAASASSPQVNTGRSITDITTNCVGTCDIGAYEFGAVPWTAGATAVTDTGGGLGPVAWWKLDDGSGTTATDSSGNNKHGTLNGPIWVAGRIGPGALQFDGINDAVFLPAGVLPSMNGSQTVCLWAFTPDVTQAGNEGYRHTMVQLWQDASNGVRVVLTEDTTPPGLWAVSTTVGGTESSRQTTTQAFVNNTWVHLCYTREAGTFVLYTNGQAQPTSDPGGYSLGDSSYLGQRTATGGQFNGRLDQIKVWSRALSPADIQSEFTGVTATSASAPHHRTVVR